MEEMTFKTGTPAADALCQKGADVTKVVTTSSQLQVYRNVDREQRKRFLIGKP